MPFISLLLLTLAGAQNCSAPLASDPLRFGQSAVLTGLQKDLGINMRAGTLAAFWKTNQAGGLWGRMMNLTTYDDQFDNFSAVNNTYRLIAENHIACISYCGTLNTASALSASIPNRVPMLNAFSGARVLRYPVNRYVVNVRAGYDDELFGFVQMCLARSLTVFSIFYQDDRYGQAGIESLTTTLSNLGITILSSGAYPAKTTQVEDGLASIMAVGIVPEVIIMIGTAWPLAKFVSLAKPIFPNTLFHGVSFLGSEIFLSELKRLNVTDAQAKDVFVTQVVPIPQPLSDLQALNGSVDLNDHVLFEFAEAMEGCCPGVPLSFGALEGYLGGMLIASVFRVMGELAPTNPDFAPYIANISNFSLWNTSSVAAVREYFLDTLFRTESFHVGGIRLGPYVENKTCVPNSWNCLQPSAPFCAEGMHNIFITQPNLTSGTFYELFDWRVNWAQCDINALPVNPLRLPIVFGQTAVLSGLASSVGRDVRNGILAAFKRANTGQNAGVRSRRLLLLSYDDEASPTNATRNAYNLIQNQSVIAILGVTGHSVSNATVTVADELGIPFIGPYTGSRTLRGNDNVVNARAGYDDEISAIVNYSLSQGWTKFALLGQDDIGDTGKDAFDLALAWNRRVLFSAATYPARTLNVAEAFDQFYSVGIPDVVAMFASAEAAAAFVTLAEKNATWAAGNVHYFCVSYVTTETFRTLIPQNLLAAPRTFFTAVVPNPLQSNLTLVQNFLHDLYDLDPTVQPSFGSLEGYIVGRLVTWALERAPNQTSAALRAEIFNSQLIPLDDLSMGPFIPTAADPAKQCNQGFQSVYVFQFDGNSTRQVEVFTAWTTQVFAADCGSFPKYSDPPCPTGYRKKYTSSTTLLSVCELCLSVSGCFLPFFASDEGVRGAMLGLNVVGCLISLACIVMVIVYRKTVVIKASSPRFCLVILVGSIIGNITTFLLYSGLENWMCMGQVYLYNTSFCFMFGALFVKVYRISQIFNQKTVKIVFLGDGMLFIAVGVLWIVEMAFTIAWHSLDPMKTVLKEDPAFLYYTCKSTSGTSTWAVANLLLNGLFLVYGIWLSIQSRHTPTAFNESKFLAACLYNALCMGSILVAAAYASKTDDEVFLFKSLGVIVVCSVGVCLLFFPKCLRVYEEIVRKTIPTIGERMTDVKRSSNTNSPRATGAHASTDKVSLDLDKLRRNETTDPGRREEPNETPL